jgi:hypothetical protein
LNPQTREGGSSEGSRVPVSRRHGSMRRAYSATMFSFHHLSVKWEEGVRLPPSSLISGRIIPALLNRFPGVSTFAAWGLRRIQRDCLFRDVAGHP